MCIRDSIKTASKLHFPHLLLYKIVSHFLYQKFHRTFVKIYQTRNKENNKTFNEKLGILKQVPISKLIKDLKIKQEFSIICIKPNDNLRANLLEYYEIKTKYSNIRSYESESEISENINDIGNYRICLESLQSLSSSNTIYQIMVKPPLN